MKKHIGIFLVTAVLVSSMTACQSAEKTDVNNNDTTDVVVQEDAKQEREKPVDVQRESHYMGEVTGIESNMITVNAMGGGRFGGGRMPEGEAPEGFDPAEKPSEMPEGEVPEGFDPAEKPSEMPEGEMPETEVMVIEVTEDTVITVNDETSEVSYLQIGDFIQFTIKDEVVTEIRVGMSQQGGPQQDDPQQGAAQNTTTEN